MVSGCSCGTADAVVCSLLSSHFLPFYLKLVIQHTRIFYRFALSDRLAAWLVGDPRVILVELEQIVTGVPQNEAVHVLHGERLQLMWSKRKGRHMDNDPILVKTEGILVLALDLALASVTMRHSDVLFAGVLW